MATREQGIEAISALLLEYGINVTSEQAGKLLDIGQRVLSDREKRTLTSLKQAHKFISYEQCFRGRLTSRVEMDEVFKRWQESRPSSTGIGIGATYLNDAEFNFEEAEKLIAEGEKLNGGPLPLPEIWA